MANAEARCKCEKCGKTFYVTNVKNSRKAANEWEEWASVHYTICQQCRDTERKKMSEAIAKEQRESGMPELRGSEKQIAWAVKIRKDFLRGQDGFIKLFDQKIARRNEQGLESPKTMAKKEAVQDITQFAISSRTSAAWWIDNRSNPMAAIVREEIGKWDIDV